MGKLSLMPCINKVLPRIFRLRSKNTHAGGSWKGDLLLADVDELQENDASEMIQEESKQRRKIF